jgi:DNA-binding SARP family transcriptional activator/RecA/RadA recombinase
MNIMMASFQLRLVGSCVLEREGQPVPLGKRSNGLLAYLALEGVTSRGQLAALLWNDTDDEKARASLRQEMYRINQVGDVLQNDRHNVWLSQDVTHDLDSFNSAEGEFAAGLLLDELDFENWLEDTRALLRDRRLAFLEQELRRLERAQSWREAMAMARRVLACNELSESAHRDYLRLAYLADDRAKVRQGIQDLQQMLRDELGVLPAPETLQFIEALETGRLPKVGAAGPRTIPVTVLRPPKLAGSKTWQALVGGVTRGRAALIVGEAGSGKTRLLSELAASRSALGARVLELRCRETDSAISFAALLQAVRDHMQLEKQLGREIMLPDPWRGELARLLPELRDPNQLYRSLEASAEFGDTQARVLEAFTQYVLAMAAPGGLLIMDDLQWADAATLQWLSYAIPRLLQFGVACLGAYRPLEANEKLRDLISKLEAAGSAAKVNLEPLALPEVEELLGGIDRRATKLAPDLLRVTGGNPLFIVETLKHLIETGRLNETWDVDGTLEPPERIGALLKRRLERLPALTRRSLGVVALADSSDTALIASTLEASEFDVAQAIADAQSAYVLSSEGQFIHDAMRRVALELLPEAVQRALHRRIGLHLETRGANPHRIAQHFLSAKDEAKAAPHLIRAAEIALEQTQPDQALTWLEASHSTALEPELEVLRQTLQAEALLALHRHGEATQEAKLAALGAYKLGRAELERRSNLALAEASLELGRANQAQLILEPLAGLLPFDLELRSKSILGWSRLIMGDIAGAIGTFEHTLPWTLEAHLGRAYLHWYSGNTLESVRAAQLALEQAPSGFKRAQVQTILSLSLWTRGQLGDALTALQNAFEQTTNHTEHRLPILLARAPIFITRGEYDRAESDLLHVISPENHNPDSRHTANANHQLALIHGLCGDLETALHLFDDAAARWQRDEDIGSILMCAALRALTLAHQHDPRAEAASTRANQLAQGNPHALGRTYAALAAAETHLMLGHFDQTLEHAEQLLHLALEFEIPEMRAHAQLIAGITKNDKAALESALTLGQTIGASTIIARAAAALGRRSIAQTALEMLLEHIPSGLRKYAKNSLAARELEKL